MLVLIPIFEIHRYYMLPKKLIFLHRHPSPYYVSTMGFMLQVLKIHAGMRERLSINNNNHQTTTACCSNTKTNRCSVSISIQINSFQFQFQFQFQYQFQCQCQFQ